MFRQFVSNCYCSCSLILICDNNKDNSNKDNNSNINNSTSSSSHNNSHDQNSRNNTPTHERPQPKQPPTSSNSTGNSSNTTLTQEISAKSTSTTRARGKKPVRASGHNARTSSAVSHEGDAREAALTSCVKAGREMLLLLQQGAQPGPNATTVRGNRGARRTRG